MNWEGDLKGKQQCRQGNHPLDAPPDSYSKRKKVRNKRRMLKECDIRRHEIFI